MRLDVEKVLKKKIRNPIMQIKYIRLCPDNIWMLKVLLLSFEDFEQLSWKKRFYLFIISNTVGGFSTHRKIFRTYSGLLFSIENVFNQISPKIVDMIFEITLKKICNLKLTLEFWLKNHELVVNFFSVDIYIHFHFEIKMMFILTD